MLCGLNFKINENVFINDKSAPFGADIRKFNMVMKNYKISQNTFLRKNKKALMLICLNALYFNIDRTYF